MIRQSSQLLYHYNQSIWLLRCIFKWRIQSRRRKQAPHYTNGNPKDIIQLWCIIYRLKQSSRKWYEKLTKELRKLGIYSLHSDHAVYRLIKDKDILLMAIYVDDSTITRSSPSLINDIQEEIGCIFKITLLRPISWLLGMEVTHDRESHTLTLSQKTYIDSLLQKFNMEKCKPAFTPLDPFIQLNIPQLLKKQLRWRNFPIENSLGDSSGSQLDRDQTSYLQSGAYHDFLTTQEWHTGR